MFMHSLKNNNKMTTYTLHPDFRNSKLRSPILPPCPVTSR